MYLVRSELIDKLIKGKEVRLLFFGGWKTGEIAAHFSCTRDYVNKILRNSRLKSGEFTPYKFPPWFSYRFTRLKLARLLGFSASLIAIVYGLSAMSVYRITQGEHEISQRAGIDVLLTDRVFVDGKALVGSVFRVFYVDEKEVLIVGKNASGFIKVDDLKGKVELVPPLHLHDLRRLQQPREIDKT